MEQWEYLAKCLDMVQGSMGLKQEKSGHYCQKDGRELELTDDFGYEDKEYTCPQCKMVYGTDYLGNLHIESEEY